MGRDLDPAVSRWWYLWGFPQISLWGGQCITRTYKNCRVNQHYTIFGNALWFVPGISQVVQLDPNYCTCSVCSSWAGCRSILGYPGRTWAIHDTCHEAQMTTYEVRLPMISKLHSWSMMIESNRWPHSCGCFNNLLLVWWKFSPYNSKLFKEIKIGWRLLAHLGPRFLGGPWASSCQSPALMRPRFIVFGSLSLIKLVIQSDMFKTSASCQCMLDPQKKTSKIYG